MVYLILAVSATCEAHTTFSYKAFLKSCTSLLNVMVEAPAIANFTKLKNVTTINEKLTKMQQLQAVYVISSHLVCH